MRLFRASAETVICFWLGILLLAATYALSVGPVAWLQTHGYLSDSVSVIYIPLSWLCDHSEPLYEVMELYVGFWK